MATTQHKAVGDDGKEYVILEIRSSIHTTTLSSTMHERESGLAMYTLSNGVRLHRNRDGTFTTSDGALTLTLI